MKVLGALVLVPLLFVPLAILAAHGAVDKKKVKNDQILQPNATAVPTPLDYDAWAFEVPPFDADAEDAPPFDADAEDAALLFADAPRDVVFRARVFARGG